MRDKRFSDYGDLNQKEEDRLDNLMDFSGKLVDDDAALYLASIFANETHGNYGAETLYRRADLSNRYRITLEPIWSGE
jgi:hypothetical protein